MKTSKLSFDNISTSIDNAIVNTDGFKVGLGGVAGIATGYALAGVAVAVESVVLAKIAVGTFYIGCGALVAGAGIEAYKSLTSDKK